MIRIRKGIVRDIITRNERIAIVNVSYDDVIQKAFNYNFLSGDVQIGDSVYLNTTATYMELGSGGYDFIIINETRGSNIDAPIGGNIMKLRYSPYQIKCFNADDANSKYFEDIRKFKSLEGMAVICGELHSMLAPVACTLKYLDRNIRIAYIMTDGGSLPIDFSFTVERLKSKGIIAGAITSGHSFGGDIESVNIYDALIAAKIVLNCDTAVVTMGPGITGTGTKYGFSGIEQGHIIDAVNTLKGVPVVIPRISFADKRARHRGISHHTLTVLSEIAKTSSYVVFPEIQKEKQDYILQQLNGTNIGTKHNVKFINGDTIFDAVKYFNINCSTMGRGIKDDGDFFRSCGSAAAFTYTSLIYSRYA